MIVLADVDPGPVVGARAFRACSRGLPVPGRGRQPIGNDLCLDRSAAVVDAYPRGACDREDVADLAGLQGRAQVRVLVVGLVAGDPGGGDPGVESPGDRLGAQAGLGRELQLVADAGLGPAFLVVAPGVFGQERRRSNRARPWPEA